MIINRIHEYQNLLSLWLVSFLVELRTYQHRLYMLPGLTPTDIHFTPIKVYGSLMAVTVEHPHFPARTVTH